MFDLWKVGVTQKEYKINGEFLIILIYIIKEVNLLIKLGLKSGTVKIEEYNSEWRNEFLKEEEVLKKQLQEYDVDIQHVGSTSIIGCCAKPIIDIAIGVKSLEYGEQLIPILCNIGYIFDGDGKIPGRLFFKKKNSGLSTHYIHVEPINGKLWNNHILFRDYLNNRPQIIIEYSNLKRRLEKNFFDNRDNYAIEKNPFIEKIIENALIEKGMLKKEVDKVVKNENITIRLMRDTIEDYNLMLKWLNDENVLQYYEGRDNSFNMDRIKKKYKKKILSSCDFPCIIQYDGVDVGYIQYYQLTDEGYTEYGYNIKEKIFGIDLFIGEVEYWNKGIGNKVLKLLIEIIRKEKKADRITIDPQAWNIRAIKCYEKCGFKKVRLMEKHELHEGEYRDCLLMEVKF